MAEVKYLCLVILKLIGLNVFRWVQTLVYFADYEVIGVINFFIILIRLIALIYLKHQILWHVVLFLIGVINFFIILIRLIALIYLKHQILWHVVLFGAEVARLLLKIAVVWPNIYGISLVTSRFFSGKSSFYSVISKNIFCHTNLICIFNSLRNATVNMC